MREIYTNTNVVWAWSSNYNGPNVNTQLSLWLIPSSKIFLLLITLMPTELVTVCV